MNACVETVSLVEDAATLVCAADFADAPRVEAEVEAEPYEALANTEELVCTEMQPAVSLATIERPAPKKRSWFFARWLGGGKVARAAKTPHIVHVRGEAFFASVEQALNPNLTGKAVLVGRGVVASASREAKLQGVQTGMSLSEALRICPDAIVVRGHYKQYADFAERVRLTLGTFTPAVETAELNGFYLNFAGRDALYPDFAALLRRMQAEILQRTGLTLSLGAARTKVLASMASRLDGTRGLRVVLPHEEVPFLATLPVEKLPGVGDARAATLKESGVSTIEQLRLVPKPVLMAAFGEAIGEQIWQHARGRDGRATMSPSTSQSVSRETAIEGGTADAEFLCGVLEYLGERIGNKLREDGKQADTIGVRISYVDDYSAQQTARLTRANSDQLELLLAARELFATLFTRRVAIRHIAVSGTALNPASSASYKSARYRGSAAEPSKTASCFQRPACRDNKKACSSEVTVR